VNPDEIEQYLTELGVELKQRGIKRPIRFLMVGGAFMSLLANAPRTTDDVDAFWLEDWLTSVSQEEIETLQKSVSSVGNKHAIDEDWFNYMTYLLMGDHVIIPKGKLWKRFGPLYIHIPSKEYILALKIVAGRENDINDARILLPQTNIKTRKQAQQLLNKHILPTGLQIHADQIEKSLEELF
jgi:hypothetical protein